MSSHGEVGPGGGGRFGGSAAVDRAYQREQRAFDRLLRDGALAAYRGRYVAVHRGAFVDADRDGAALVRRLGCRLGRRVFFVGFAGTEEPRVDRQVAGWVFERAEEARGPLPAYRTDAALLPQVGADVLSEPCLLLVEVNYVWCVRSEPGANTYSHGSALNRGAEVTFRPESDPHRLWTIRKQGIVEPGKLVSMFGPVVAPERVDITSQTRARADAPSLLVSVREAA